jgi:CubicO group peptidase (beta-lactamase class C family)
MNKLLSMIILCATQQSLAQIGEIKAQKIDSLLTVIAENQLFNGSVLIGENGQVIYKKSIGYIDRSRKLLNSDTTCFNLASLSKPFTATAVLQLVQKGRLKLDDPITRYFPDFPYQSVHIRHLLTHTSGLPMLEKQEDSFVRSHPEVIMTNAMVYSDLLALKKPLLFQPGDDERYNNMNYVLLAMLVEKISRLRFSDYMNKNIFSPAGMHKSYIRTANMPNTPRYIQPAMYSSTYQNVDSIDHVLYYTNYNLGSLYGPNNVVSNLEDLYNFDIALSTGKLISRAFMDSAFTPVILNNGKPFHMGTSTRSYGFGWNLYNSKTDPADKFIFHDGHIVGLSTVLHRSLGKNQTIIFYDNTGHAPLQLMLSLSNILNDQPAQKIRVAKSLVRLYGETLVHQGPEAAISQFLTLKHDSSHYYMDELELNTLGFDLLKAPLAGYQQLALEVFKINILLYNSANSYDSYAEALAKNGKKEAAILMYQKAIVLSPENEDSKRALKKLLE